MSAEAALIYIVVKKDNHGLKNISDII